jgi:hypothetical protein
VFDATIEFSWERPAKGRGFVWREAENGLTHLARFEGARFEVYRPLDEASGLFRSFADLWSDPADPAAFLAFANCYGSLDVPWEPDPAAFQELSNRYGPFASPGPSQDVLGQWRAHVGHMNFLVRLWDGIREGDWPALRGVLANTEAGDPFRATGPGELVEAGLRLLGESLSTHLRWLPGTSNPPLLQWNPAGKRVMLRLVPSSLVEAMYLQFLRAMGGGKNFQRCLACRRWFELAPGVGRADKKTCSTSCRVKIYQGRRRRAREMHAEGKTVKQIARELGSAADTVKRWVKDTGEK